MTRDAVSATYFSPYQGLAPEHFWRTGVAAHSPETIEGLYRKRFDIPPEMRIATAGSCFAQHIAGHMRAHGTFTVADAEPAPSRLPNERASRYGYRMYSARYGNIYVPRQLVQLIDEAFGRFEPQNAIWERDGRYYDALRPNVEPNGLGSVEEVLAHREQHLAAVRALVGSIDLLVFTFGLTESWEDRASGTVYPTAPGTIAGDFDPTIYAFRNFSYDEIRADFLEIRARLRDINPDIKFLVTVSPVPLTATASGQHVLSATIYSKSVLRAVTGSLYSEFDDVDYFPSYELVASHFSEGKLYEPNMRSVSRPGVNTVMGMFMAEHRPDGGPARKRADAPAKAAPERKTDDDVICEEALLDAFAS